jgi:hypothetical protein
MCPAAAVVYKMHGFTGYRTRAAALQVLGRFEDKRDSDVKIG